VGIQVPTEDSLGKIEADVILSFTDKSLATSGNYRKYYIRDNVRFSHTIDPISGYPVQHSLLSVSVLAGSTALADAYATAFMVMGKDKTISFLSRHAGLDVYLIYYEGEEMRYWASDGMKKLILE